jgi:hypothetical protein
MVPTFIADRSTGAAPSFPPAASPRVRRRPSSWPPRQPRNTGHGVAHPTGQACTAPRPTSARLEPMPRLRGFNHWFASATPSRLACRTRAVWQCRPVPSLSGLLPPAPCASRARLPPASATRCDGPPLNLSFHSIIDASWRTTCSQHNRGKSQGRPVKRHRRLSVDEHRKMSVEGACGRLCGGLRPRRPMRWWPPGRCAMRSRRVSAR